LYIGFFFVIFVVLRVFVVPGVRDSL